MKTSFSKESTLTDCLIIRSFTKFNITLPIIQGGLLYEKNGITYFRRVKNQLLTKQASFVQTLKCRTY